MHFVTMYEQLLLHFLSMVMSNEEEYIRSTLYAFIEFLLLSIILSPGPSVCIASMCISTYSLWCLNTYWLNHGFSQVGAS